MAFLVQGRPQTLSVIGTDVITDSMTSEHPAVAQRVMVKGQQASIIDMEKLESIIRDII